MAHEQSSRQGYFRNGNKIFIAFKNLNECWIIRLLLTLNNNRRRCFSNRFPIFIEHPEVNPSLNGH